jgi:hypothetical protein
MLIFAEIEKSEILPDDGGSADQGSRETAVGPDGVLKKSRGP